LKRLQCIIIKNKVFVHLNIERFIRIIKNVLFIVKLNYRYIKYILKLIFYFPKLYLRVDIVYLYIWPVGHCYIMSVHKILKLTCLWMKLILSSLVLICYVPTRLINSLSFAHIAIQLHDITRVTMLIIYFHTSKILSIHIDNIVINFILPNSSWYYFYFRHTVASFH